jgi:NAD(P)-dependent dehydrogenase (short-subunit alcohol dehydrogenase family)
LKRIALISGVAGGIGGATSRAFTEAGWHVIGVDRKHSDSLPGVSHLVHADVAKADEVERLFAKVGREEGRIDALINNSAVQMTKPLVEMKPEEWDDLMASNVRSAYLLSRCAYPLMSLQGGVIVNVSSVHAIATSANIAAYAASKGALLALTRALAIELAPDRIRVNAVLPGAVDTPMLRAGLRRNHLAGQDMQEQMEELARRTVIGRVGKPEEIAQAILFLADEYRSSFITGQALLVDGGATARLSTE